MRLGPDQVYLVLLGDVDPTGAWRALGDVWLTPSMVALAGRCYVRAELAQLYESVAPPQTLFCY